MVHGWPTLYSSVDAVFYAISGVSVVLLVGVTAVMIFFVIRYRKSRNPNPENIEGNMTLEILWTVIPTLLVLAMFYVGWKGFVFMRTVPDNAMLVKVTARKWSWSFEYGNGKKTDVLTIPIHTPVKLSISSSDVLHSLFIPAFRVKEDAVPGMETYLWFQPDETGSYDLFCTEYCGVGHSAMITTVEVVPEKEFAAWYKKEKKPVVATAKEPKKKLSGQKLIKDKGCIVCHSSDGSKLVGPSFKGIFGRATVVVTAGKERSITADEAYIRKSILDPNADVVKGYPPIMPPQKDLLSTDEVQAIIEHLKTLQ